MGFLDVVKILFVPALVASALYVLLAHIVVPLYRRHHQRYAQYLPVDTISERTSSLRARLKAAISRLILPSSMRWSREVVDARRASISGDELAFGEEEGENLVGFDDFSARNRLQPGRDERGGRVEIDSQRRLSRDLEEGFKDDSEEEGESSDVRWR